MSDFCINFDCTKIGYKCQVLCEFMQGSFVVVLDLLFLVPTYFLLVGFINAEFDWSRHWGSVGCCEGRTFSGWRS